MTQLSPLDQSIINMINAIRADHHACTAGAVALRLQLSKSYIINRCELLRAQGIVTWTSFPGSLRVVTPVTVDATEPARRPVGRPRKIVPEQPVTKPADPVTYRTTTPVVEGDGPTHQGDSGEGISSDSDISPHTVSPSVVKKRKKSSS